MRIAVTGGTGFIGRHLVSHLLSKGYEVVVISRQPSRPPAGAELLTWEQLRQGSAAPKGWYGIINLAGESINQRWTPSAKERILQSRLLAASMLAEWVSRMEEKPEVVISGSGINAYGFSETAEFQEGSQTAKDDFLSRVVGAWEAAAEKIEAGRLVKLRTGVVLGTDGGALPSMALPYKLFAGGPVGSGKQWLSWIHIQDMVRLIEFALQTDSIRGPLNAVSPEPVRNASFGKALGGVLRRPHWLPAPAWGLKLALGELSELLLKGQRVLPAKALQEGFHFMYPDLEAALQDLYGGSAAGG